MSNSERKKQALIIVRDKLQGLGEHITDNVDTLVNGGLLCLLYYGSSDMFTEPFKKVKELFKKKSTKLY